VSRITAVSESDATLDAQKTFERVKEMLGAESLPEMFLVYGRVPAFLRDFYMNFKKFVYSDGKIDAKTKSAIALAVSARDGCDPWTDFLTGRARQLGWEEGQIADILAVAATSAMYNTFFKFRDISGSDLFGGMPVGLRAHTFANTSLEDTIVELINIAISDLNGCKPCTSGHVDKARKLGISDDAILETVQCAATILAGTQFLNSAGY